MLEMFNLEKQASKRVKTFLLHKSTEFNIPFAEAKIVISQLEGKTLVQLCREHEVLSEIPLNAIAEFYGKVMEPAQEEGLIEYFKELSVKFAVPLSDINLVVKEHKEEMRCFLYNGPKYVAHIKTLQLLNRFYF